MANLDFTCRSKEVNNLGPHAYAPFYTYILALFSVPTGMFT